MNEDKNKGLADNGDGEFILNESGTSVTIEADDNITFSEDENAESKNGGSPKTTENTRKS